LPIIAGAVWVFWKRIVGCPEEFSGGGLATGNDRKGDSLDPPAALQVYV